MKRIPYINMLPVILLSIAGYKFLSEVDILKQVSFFTMAVKPFIWALGIAMVLKQPVEFIGKYLKVKEPISILIVYVCSFVLLGLSIVIVMPTLAKSFTDLFKAIPGFYKIISEYVLQIVEGISTEEVRIYINSNVTAILTKANEIVTTYGGAALNVVFSTTSLLADIVFGFLISIYLLTGRHYFGRIIKKGIYATASEGNAGFILKTGYNAIDKFSSFVGGKVIDSAIIGVIAYVTFVMIKAPYAMILALIVGLTNMIPYFGPFIGGIPAVGLSLFYGWQKALIVGIAVLIIQQFDGWYLGPKILGDKLGLRPFWIILAVIIGGAYFGPIGMFLGTPILAVIIDITTETVNKSLNKRKIKID